MTTGMAEEAEPNDEWVRHESLRRSLWNRAPMEDATDRRLSLMIIGSLPSGDARIVSLRSQLSGLLFGNGIREELNDNSTYVAPTVFHFVGQYLPAADSVCVGTGACSLTLSPWSCPIPAESYSAAAATEWIRLRMDNRSWLQRLSGKKLGCNCGSPAPECWAQLLINEFTDRFEVRGYESDCTDDGDSVDFDGNGTPHTAWPREYHGGEGTKQMIPEHVPWPNAWIKLAQNVRSLGRPSVWEIFSGSARLTKAFEGHGVWCAPPVDVIDDPNFNLLNCMFVAVLVGLMAAHLIDMVHISPPDDTFTGSSAKWRSLNPEGNENLQADEKERIRVGNVLAEVAATMIKVQAKAGNHYQLEQPLKSVMMHLPVVKKAIAETGGHAYRRDAAADGAPWKKPLILITANAAVGKELTSCRKPWPSGRIKSVTRWMGTAVPYWPAWAEAVAKTWTSALRSHVRKANWEQSAPMLMKMPGATAMETMRTSNHVPAGGRSVEKAADTMAGGIQATRKKLPQLLPDGLPPDMHLQAAMTVQNPLSYPMSSTVAVDYALRNSPDDFEDVMDRRAKVATVLRQLSVLCEVENAELLALCEVSVATVLKAFGTKNVPLMRELAYVCGTQDIASPALLLLGLPMLGWAPVAEGLMRRTKMPIQTMEEFLEDRAERNEKIIGSTKPSADTKRDEQTFAKTKEEADIGVLVGPFLNLADVPMKEVALVPRNGIWEQHGGATEPTVRGIDNMLTGRQNSTVGTVSTHRPTDPDALAAQVRAVRERHPNVRLSGYPCDLRKAYKQVPNCPAKLQWTVVCVWSTEHGRPVFYVALCQLFGGKSPPLNFARYPAWLTECAAVLFALPLTHCVDDIIGIEPDELAMSGNIALKILCSVTGWAISETKAPPPASSFVVIGVELNLEEVPDKEATIRVSERRVEQLTKTLKAIKAEMKLGPGEAAALTGALGFSLCAVFGRFGRAKLKPFIRRSSEMRNGPNRQILAATEFWLKFLIQYRPREVPAFLSFRETVVTYSDGEGADAGLGIALWSSRCPRGPLAAYCEIPEVIRCLWDKQKAEEHRDIFLIEAVGPLALLTTFPKMLKGTMWTHYIDNVGAEYSLVKGSSSTDAGDIVVGETWKRIAELDVFPYFDRVASESNPVDGLSRGRRHGPWEQVIKAKLPSNLEKLLAEEVRSDSDID